MKTTKLFIHSLLLVFGLLASASANAYFYEKQKSFEVFQPRILITKKGFGFASGKRCADCEVLKFIVTPKTKAFNLKGKKVKLQKANRWSGKGVSFTYEKKSRKLIKIIEEFGAFK